MDRSTVGYKGSVPQADGPFYDMLLCEKSPDIDIYRALLYIETT